MTEESWFSRLLGRRPGEEGSPPVSASAEAPAKHHAEYQKQRDRGLRELKAGGVEKAMSALGRAVQLQPDLADAHLNMGRAFERAGKVEAARKAYERALEIDLTCAEARSALNTLPPPPPGRVDFQVGQVLGSGTTGSTYKVLEVKRGGFGIVYIAREEKSGSLYALKTFQARYLWSDEDRERFEREAVTWVMLDRHPNIVTAHTAERIEGLPYLVLEYVSGGDLAHLLQEGSLPVERALELALQFCDGMAYAHGRLGIVHRDVKPANCLLAGDGMLKVTDFGLARAFGRAQEGLLGLSGLGLELETQYTTPLGTSQYMAPEQFRAGAQLDTRTDVYAFGIMLYQMVTGDLPRIGSAAQAHIQANSAAHDLPEDTLRLILWCVEPDPERRPADLGQVRQALEAIYRSATGKAAPCPAEPCSMGAAEWNNKGVALYALERYEEGLACLDRGLEIDPWDSDLWKGKGAALLALGRHHDALACSDRALEFASRDIGLWNNKGLALRALGRWEEALVCFERGLEVDPHVGQLWKNKGAVLGALGRSEQELACFERALEIAPRDNDLWNDKGLALGSLGRYEEALACFDRALEIAPRDSEAWKNKGVALDRLGRSQEALACFERGLEIRPQDGVLWNNKGAVLVALGRHGEALDCWDRGLEISPLDGGLWKKKGQALGKLGRHREALACFERGLEVSLGDSDLWNRKGLTLDALGHYEEALACFERGLAIAPRDAGLWHNKGAAAGKLGRHEEALACFERGLEIEARDSGLWMNKGLALRALGRTREAEACIRWARELGAG